MLPVPVQRQLTPPFRRGPHPLSACLFDALERNKWLVRSLDTHHLPAELPLWNALVGKYLFKGTLIVEVPPALLNVLPLEDWPEALSITGPTYDAEHALQRFVSTTLQNSSGT
jgi:hypothetical protein